MYDHFYELQGFLIKKGFLSTSIMLNYLARETHEKTENSLSSYL